jgi:hypothetical protein
MDSQQFFNLSVAIIGVLGGWFMRVMWQSLQELRSQDSKLAEKVGNIEVLVAGQYVKRDDMDKSMTALFMKLDRIEDKIDKKADKL